MSAGTRVGDVIARLWSALGGDPRQAAEVEVRRSGRYLPSGFDVDGVAVGAVGAMLLAAAEHAEAAGQKRPSLALDAEHVAVAFVSERHLSGGGGAFAPLSRFARTRDGWIRLHANYPHHREALLTTLETTEDRALDAVAGRDSEELETAIVQAAGAAAAMRTPEEWARHPQGRAVASLPLIELTAAPAQDDGRWAQSGGRGVEGGGRRAHSGGSRADRDGPRPAERGGFRVLDLTRVIAGPVATRMLAALGADVLRIDPPHLPELELSIRDGCPGKRMAQLDLRTGMGTLHELLARADVLVHGYRPGALAALGLDEDRYPHLVVASLSAWGEVGPWAQRRGFDSLVQSACGIAALEGDGTEPGALPAQVLDHATGYLMAAAVLRALAARRRGEPHANARLALAATARELMRHPSPDTELKTPDPQAWMVAVGGDRLVAPPGELDGRRLSWRHGPRRSDPVWT